jgi:hypothetical protein
MRRPYLVFGYEDGENSSIVMIGPFKDRTKCDQIAAEFWKAYGQKYEYSLVSVASGLAFEKDAHQMHPPRFAEKPSNILYQLQDIARNEPSLFFEYVITDEDEKMQQAERDEYEALMRPA